MDSLLHLAPAVHGDRAITVPALQASSSPGVAKPWEHGGAHRCRNCRLVQSVCVCALAPRLALRGRVIVIMHANEWPRASNTGHFVQLALQRSAIRVHGLPHTPVDLADVDPESTSEAVLTLFPGHGAKPLDQVVAAAPNRPWTLLIPDGNWGQTKSMMRRVPCLQKAQAVELPGPILGDRPRPRRNLFGDRMSTFEAIAQALGHLEGPEVQDQLLAFFCTAVDRMLALRGTPRAGARGFA